MPVPLPLHRMCKIPAAVLEWERALRAAVPKGRYVVYGPAAVSGGGGNDPASTC